MTIGIIGAGAWGTALAQSAASAGHDVLIQARESDVVASINAAHENKLFLPGILLDPRIKATSNPQDAADADIVLIVTPAQHLRAGLKSIALAPGKPLVICAKGIEISTGKLLSQVAEEEVPQAVPVVLSGPTFAAEIAKGLPSAITIACRDEKIGHLVRTAMASRSLRPYSGTDLIGAQVGGAIKNVIAISCGIIAGKKLGDSARAALLTRGLAEMARLSESLGGLRETLMGMCGVGDLMLTCSSMQSRNFSLGFALGEGRKLTDILGERTSVAEGVPTAAAVISVAGKYKIDMPICAAVHRCVHGHDSADQAIAALLDRPLRSER